MQEVDDIINICPQKTDDEGLRSALEEANSGDLRSVKISPKGQNGGTVIETLVIYFDGKSFKSGKQLLIKEQESKDETYSFIKVKKNVMFTHMSAKSGINVF